MEEGEREVVVNQEEKLPSPEELIPLSQSLVDRNLASAFDIPTTTNPNSFLYPIPPSPLIPSHPSHQWMAGTNFDSVYLNSCCSSPFGFVFKKKKRTIWTPQLHRKFVEAVVRLGLENAAPGAITETMNVDGLSKESVNSHLQQFRLRLQREGILIKSGRKWRSLVPDADLTTDRLFAIIPLPLGAAAAAGGDERSDSEERTDSEEKSDSEERSEEGCEENKELSPFPTGKDLSDDRDSCGSDDNEVVRTKKKRRTVWTPQLHKKFVEAVAHLGVQNATPKAITETMNVDGLSRDSVSSHLQKYREFLEQKVNQIRKGVKKSVVLPGDSAMDRQITTIPLPSGPTSAPAGVDDGSFPLLFMNMASAKVENLSSVDGSEERSKEGCRENKELSLFPTGKGLSDGKENRISDDEELTKTNKKGSTVWTPKLYKMFVEVVAHLGIENATPGAIMEKMNVEGLSRDSVSNQLQRYILLLEQEWHRKKVVSAGYSTMDQLSATMLLPCGAAPPLGDERSKLDERIRIACGEIKELPLFPTGKDLSDRRGTCRSDEDEVVRNTKKQRTVWTPQLQKKFAEAVAQLGLENATAGAITKMMNVDGLTRDSVSSHLQNYRLHLQHLANSHGTSPARGDERSDLEARSKEGCGKIKELPLLLAGKDLSRDNCRDLLVKNKKKWKSVWTLDLHKMFVEAATHLGLENATPGAITERMNVDGLTNEIVSNYLQEYRLYLQRKGVLINSGGKWQMNNVVSAPAKDLR